MSRNDRCINHSVFEVWITVYRIEKILKYTGVSPSAEPFKNRVPIAEAFGQITPRRARPHTPENRLHEPSSVATACSRMAGFAGQEGPHPLPKLIRNTQTIFVHSNLRFKSLKQRSNKMGIPYVNRP